MRSHHGVSLSVIIAICFFVHGVVATDGRDDTKDDRSCKWGKVGDCNVDKTCPDGTTCKKYSKSDGYCCLNEQTLQENPTPELTANIKSADENGRPNNIDITGTNYLPASTTLLDNTGTETLNNRNAASSDQTGTNVFNADKRKWASSNNSGVKASSASNINSEINIRAGPSDNAAFSNGGVKTVQPGPRVPSTADNSANRRHQSQDNGIAQLKSSQRKPAPTLPVCQQPKVVGPCRLSIPRWFFNSMNNACEQFIYGGCGGNNNNFERKRDCENQCGVITPPIVPVCEQPKVVGPCRAAIDRWFYNYKTKCCEHFIYGGCQGNDNNFGRKVDCEKQCGVVPPPILPVCEQPKVVGPCRAAIDRWFYNYKTKCCEHFIYGGCDGNANNFGRKVDCEKQCGVVPPPQKPVCKQPKEVGPCRGAIPRWFYNFKTKACEQFIYGGCNGNDNNFGRKEDCVKRCGPRLPICVQPMKRGPCLASIPRWFYNYKTEACEQFSYGGCKANDNNFERKEDCEKRCVCTYGKEGVCGTIAGLTCRPGTTCRFRGNFQDASGKCCIDPPPVEVCPYGKKGLCGTSAGLTCIPGTTCSFMGKYPGATGKCCIDPPPVPRLPVCVQPKKVGPCYGAIPRWFYNYKTEACEQFTFGGCDANDNNFERREDCEQRCVCTYGQKGVCGTNAGLTCKPGTTCRFRGNFPEGAGKCCIDPPPVEKCKYGQKGICGTPAGLTCRPGTTCSFMGNFAGATGKCCIDPPPVVPVCEQPKEVGPCTGSIPRWFYNYKTEACEKFIYGGCHGNDNNFERREACEKRCEVCPYGQNGVCGTREGFTCRPGTTCSFMGNFPGAAGKCCKDPPPVVPVCKQPKEVGPCTGHVPRWFYNYKTKACEKFVYGGCHGNDNNFERREDCEKRCEVCPYGQNGVCGTSEGFTCRPGTTCSFMGNFPGAAGKCCNDPPPNLPVCKQPKEVGPCTGHLPRWFFNYKTKACEKFIYGGCHGNDNNFERREDCEKRCGAVLPVCKQPAKRGPCNAEIPRWFYNYKTEACEKFIYGGCKANGNNFERKQDCEQRCEVCPYGQKGVCKPSAGLFCIPGTTCSFIENIPGAAGKCCIDPPPVPVCKQPKEVGPCTGHFPRWFYNVKTKACEKFIYGGCHGNDNNFERREDCEKRCGTVLPVCKQPAKRGPCNAEIPRWFYNYKTEACEKFIYGGCKANGNNFERKQDCEQRCEVCPYGQNGVCGTSAGFTCRPGTTCSFIGNFPGAAGKCCTDPPPVVPVCEQPKEVGPCTGHVPRWFYNVNTKACEKFIYGGCHGNDNNFERRENCEKRCGPVLPVCKQPAKRGPCNAEIPRWFYNYKTEACEQFIYGGCKANDNNFERKQDCEQRCEVCPFGQNGVCGTSAGLTCLPGSTCSFIGNFQGAAGKCCIDPPTVPVCEQPKEVGPCSGHFPRWFFNYKTNACEKFVYGGCHGNDNNFERREDCEKRCGPVLPVCKQPAKRGPCNAEIPRWFYNYKTEACEKFIYGGCKANDNNFERKQDCEQRCEVCPYGQNGVCGTSEGFTCRPGTTCSFMGNFPGAAGKCCTDPPPNLPVCEQPKEVGPCTGHFPRWFYNCKTKACEKFIYGGCHGNDNNFERREGCEKRCGPVLPVLPVCKQPAKRGPCNAEIPRWFYNYKTEACEQFIYGGCKANDNNFERKQDCEQRCEVCPYGQKGVCGTSAGLTCRPGTTCSFMGNFPYAAGKCCIDPQPVCQFGSSGPCFRGPIQLGPPCQPGYTCNGEICCKNDAHECPAGQDGICGQVGDIIVGCKPGTTCIKAKCCIDNIAPELPPYKTGTSPISSYERPVVADGGLSINPYSSGRSGKLPTYKTGPSSISSYERPAVAAGGPSINPYSRNRSGSQCPPPENQCHGSKSPPPCTTRECAQHGLVCCQDKCGSVCKRPDHDTRPQYQNNGD